MNVLLITLLLIPVVEANLRGGGNGIYLDPALEDYEVPFGKTTTPDPTTYKASILLKTPPVPPTNNSSVRRKISEDDVKQGLYINEDDLETVQVARGRPSAPPTRGDDSTHPKKGGMSTASATPVAPMEASDEELATKQAETREGFWTYVPVAGRIPSEVG